jgi:polysaccharide deacetylase family protein (PEP-CTERM system associated)
VILDILARHGVQATFFVVGWIAEKYPALVQTINRHGHEIGCHSYLHRKIYDLTPEEFREDTRRAKNILEDITGKSVSGYRAPSYSITKKSLWALDILEELGFEYDSSIFPIYHDNYGIPDAPRFEYKLPNNNMTEYPISTSLFMGRKIPVAGGGYFRLFPYWFTKMCLKTINIRENRPFIFYLHPWEIDSNQPRMKRAKLLSKFRHYNNLNKTAERFTRLLEDFSFGPIQPSRPS